MRKQTGCDDSLPSHALTVRQPWASAIFVLGKDVENRTWPTKFRGRVAIHAASKVERVALGISPTPVSSIIGDVEIVDCVIMSGSKWFDGPFGFVLRKPRLYRKPIPHLGMLGFWKLPDAALAEIAKQVR